MMQLNWFGVKKKKRPLALDNLMPVSHSGYKAVDTSCYTNSAFTWFWIYVIETVKRVKRKRFNILLKLIFKYCRAKR